MGNRGDSSGSSGSEGEYDPGHSGHPRYNPEKGLKRKEEREKRRKERKEERHHRIEERKKERMEKKGHHRAPLLSVLGGVLGGSALLSHHDNYPGGSTAQAYFDSFGNGASMGAGSGHHSQEYSGNAGQDMDRPPPSGIRLPLDASISVIPHKVPPEHERGPAPCYDIDGQTPIYIGSALLDNSVQPCKIVFHLLPYAWITTELQIEMGHFGRYDLLPFVPAQMEFVKTRSGMVPPGRMPIEGGYEDGGKLYHAVATVDGHRVPGKTGEHLRGCKVGFLGLERFIPDGYEILCWKQEIVNYI